MKISVLLTVYNRKETTLECLRQFNKIKNEGYFFYIYLVDDGSTDGTSEAVSNKYPNVHIIKGTGNLYWCRGMVEAWKQASKSNPDYYLWLNDDTMLFENAVQEMLSAYSKVGKQSIIAGAIVSTDGKSVSYGGKVKEKLIAPNGKVQELEKINGNCVLVPREVYETIGMLDPVFHHAYGDWEYGIRLRKKGGKLYLTPSFVGSCDRHDKLPKCYNTGYGIIERFINLYSPIGPCPTSAFYYDVKCRSIIRALVNFSYMNVRCAFPYFWSKTSF